MATVKLDLDKLESLLRDFAEGADQYDAAGQIKSGGDRAADITVPMCRLDELRRLHQLLADTRKLIAAGAPQDCHAFW